MNEEIRNNLLEEYTLKDLLDVLIPVLTTDHKIKNKKII